MSRRLVLFLVGIPLITHLIVFGYAYLTGGNISSQWIVPLYFVISLVWLLPKLRWHTKILCVIGTFALNMLIGVGLLFSTMFLPGSKEHNYIMFNVCFPAMEKYYGVDQLYKIPGDEVDAQGNRKWWYQHLECEENVRKGRGAVWSENPSGFVPVKKQP